MAETPSITCSACTTEGKKPNAAGSSCYTCPDEGATAGCSSCSADNTCEACVPGKILKTDGNTKTCVAEAECTAGFFVSTANSAKTCISCTDNSNGVPDCATCEARADDKAKAECLSCTGTKKPNTTGTACVACTIADCANCDKENVCEACTSNKKLSPLKDACLTDCPAGTYDNTNICTPCHTSCASCESNANQDSCTACYPGHVLNKSDSSTTGTCIPECTGRYAENCEAGMCTAVLGGSKYCSRCKSGYVPVDGVCTAMSAGARDASGCKASGGKCTACTGTNYALLSGGCYNTKALPGSAVCTAATSGSCTTCANGQTYTSGTCPACAEGCSACSNGNTQQCTKCLAGYYLDSTASKCVKCSENSADGKIQGVKDCVSCKEPPSGSGPVTCYVTQTPTVDPTDPSVNKGGLSTGAIAGISVAAVVVVGGLVGFLCWWFVCRGKA
ncbi:Variant-specific surface protein [Giardia duodenalis]|uniref:Variant-specific surface protein n=1 Tax=Giardia intestinalis TaxID=5741 RepID=V6TNS0_GIAIN|nr:Variant-specific surface protein [Giardia intestinalis]